MTQLRRGTDNGPPPMKLVTPTDSASAGPTPDAASTSSQANPPPANPGSGTAAAPGPAPGAGPELAPFTGTATPLMRLVESPAGPAALAPTAPAAAVDPSSWTVLQGDNLWDISAAVQASAGVQDEGLIHRYWLELIAANRDRLADPNNPDLVFVGQQLRLPPHAGT